VEPGEEVDRRDVVLQERRVVTPAGSWAFALISSSGIVRDAALNAASSVGDASRPLTSTAPRERPTMSRLIMATVFSICNTGSSA